MDIRKEIRALSVLREKKGVALAEIATATKIRLSYLQAIEAGEIETLPQGVYRVNYLMQYARFIDPESADRLSVALFSGLRRADGPPPRNPRRFFPVVIAMLGCLASYVAGQSPARLARCLERRQRTPVPAARNFVGTANRDELDWRARLPGKSAFELLRTHNPARGDYAALVHYAMCDMAAAGAQPAVGGN